MNDRLYSFLGLMQKAGKVFSGDEVVSIDIKKGRCKLLILSVDASENTICKFQEMAKKYGINYICFGEKEKLGCCIGKSQRTVLSIRDEKTAAAFISKINQQQQRG